MMGRGDCTLYFMDIAEDELKKTAGQVSITRMQSLLELGALCPVPEVSISVYPMPCTPTRAAN